MKLADRFKNIFLFNDKYRTHSEAVIIACYFNPQRNPYRLSAFRTWYESIKHLNHEIVECVIDGSTPELVGEFPSLNIHRVFTPNLLWHKEALLNGIVNTLPKQYKYVFWLDTDVIFANNNWLVEAVEVLQHNNLVQPFDFCVHLDQDEMKPSFDVDQHRASANYPQLRHPKLWRSFSYNHVLGLSDDQNYDKHGHVGFAWGARREVLDAIPLYDKALIGGADHIIAHAGAGHIAHSCITKSFTDDIDAVNEWSRKFYAVVRGKIGYVPGDLYHIWHGAVEKRQYLKRIQEHTPEIKKITKKDKNGLYVTDDDTYVKKYFDQREVKTEYPVVDLSYMDLYPEVQRRHSIKPQPTQQQQTAKRAEFIAQYPDSNDSFIESLMWGYMTDSTIMGTAMGGNVVGAMIGDMLNDDRPITEQLDEIPNGDNNNQSDSTQVDMDVPNDNFS